MAAGAANHPWCLMVAENKKMTLDTFVLPLGAYARVVGDAVEDGC